MSDDQTSEEELASDFIRNVVRDDLAVGRTETVVTRFPPEPNGN